MEIYSYFSKTWGSMLATAISNLESKFILCFLVGRFLFSGNMAFSTEGGRIKEFCKYPQQCCTKTLSLCKWNVPKLNRIIKFQIKALRYGAGEMARLSREHTVPGVDTFGTQYPWHIWWLSIISSLRDSTLLTSTVTCSHLHMPPPPHTHFLTHIIKNE